MGTVRPGTGRESTLPPAWAPSLQAPTPRASRPPARLPRRPYPTQAGLAVADAPPVEAGTLPAELLCGLQERKPRVPGTAACP